MKSVMRTFAFMLALAFFAGTLVATDDTTADAAPASQFDPGQIISDQLFYDGDAMSVLEIQKFLQDNIGTCLNSNCLSVVRTDTASKQSNPMCAAYSGAPQESAAAIIYKVQRACSISAKVLLVTLQKEQSLVTHKSPSLSKLDRATGYACPDDVNRPGWCDPSSAGLYNQLYLSAWQFKRYSNPPGTSNFFNWYPVGQVSNVRFHPNAACGSTPVRIQNAATAALYYYTPYQPNAAALGNLYGIGDSCSAYGNRNFWRMYSDWFGNPVLPFGSPEGEVKELWSESNSIKMWGWALDPSEIRASISIHIKVDERWIAWTADTDTPASEAPFPGSGRAHGFGGSIAATPGTHQVCVYAVNILEGQNQELTCQTIVVPDGTPDGEVKDFWATTNAIHAWGWAADRDAVNSPSQLHISVNGRWFVRQADQDYPAPVNVIRNAGPRTGFGFEIPTLPGKNTVCIYAINVGPGANKTLLCRDIVVPDGSPVGAWQGTHGSLEGISLWGWAADGDAADPTTDIHVRVGASWHVLRANQFLPSAAAQAPGGGEHHGWAKTIATSPGTHSVCAWAINKNQGANLSLGCRQVVVPAPTTYTGAVVAKTGVGTPVNGVVVRIEKNGCDASGGGVWEQTTASNRWASGGFGIGLQGGEYCMKVLSVPAGYLIPAPQTFSAQSSPLWLTAWIPAA